MAQIAVLLLASLQALPARAAQPQPPSLFVLNLKAEGGVEDNTVRLLNELLLTEFARSGRFAVVGGSDLKTLMARETEKLLAGCTDVACFSEVAGALGAEFLAVASIGRLGSRYVLNLKVLDTGRATVVGRASRDVETEDELITALASAVAAVLESPAGATAEPQSPPPAPGDILIESSPPGATCKTGDEVTCVSPCTISGVSAGEHEVSALLSGYRAQTARLTVAPAATTEWRPVLEPLPVPIEITTSPPGAELILDDAPRGSAPIEAELLPGAHTLVATMPGFDDHDETFEVEVGAASSITVELDPIRPFTRRLVLPSFISGGLLAAFGGVAAWQAARAGDSYAGGDLDAADRSRAWAGLMYTGFATGVVAIAAGFFFDNWPEENSSSVDVR